VFVGDSLNRNMWESLACILYAAVPDRSRTRIVDDGGSEYRIFRAMVRGVVCSYFWHRFFRSYFWHRFVLTVSSWRVAGIRVPKLR
jgi:hypothetical protein